MNSRTFLIGWDGATYTVLDPLMAQGVMPNLRSFVARGVSAELRSVIPALTPPAWTSLMTGRSPGQHGILDFLRFELKGGDPQLRVVDAGDVGTETIWSIVGRQGGSSTVLNFPMTFPVRDIAGNVVPGWVPWKHLRLACHPKGLYDRITAAIPNFNPREMAMDMALEERALEGCHGIEDFENLIDLHIRRERQWFEVLRMLMREAPADLTAILFDGVDKLQHICWRFLDPALFPAEPTPTELRIRERCLEYFREIDRFLGEIISAAGHDASVIIASDHGFGPTVEVFHVNAWLHKHGYLQWAGGVEATHSETLGIGTMAKRFFEVDWERTVAYCPTPSSNGIYITPSGGRGDEDSQERYERLRREIKEGLLAFRDPATGEPVIREIWEREEIFAGPAEKSAPDLTLVLRDGGLSSILPSAEILTRRAEITGAHRANGVFIAAGPGMQGGTRIDPLSILDVAPVLLHTLGLPIPHRLEGRMPEEIFEADSLRSRPVKAETEWAPAPAPAPERPVDMPMEAEILNQLRALGYME